MDLLTTLSLILGLLGAFGCVAGIVNINRANKLEKVNRKLIQEKNFSKVYENIQQNLLERSLIAGEEMMDGVYYHPETDTLVPFEDLVYVGEF